MTLQTAYTSQVFNFNFQARTSRGAMRERKSWFVKIWEETNPAVYGIGECAPLPGLSVDDVPEYEDRLREALRGLQELSVDSGQVSMDKIGSLIKQVVPAQYPSIVFGLETALLDLSNGGKRIIFDNDFQSGRELPINGLIWMSDMDLMLQQIAIKVYDGFSCIKMKVGSLNFEKECDILHYIRKKYYREDITIRLDANGAFKADDCLYKLKELAKFGIHSIEQPIKAGQSDLLREIAAQSPIPIALDEELIGVYKTEDKQSLLEACQVPYIILKPSLHGGIQSCLEWIQLAEDKKMGWWITSALESNIGLNAICQLTAQFPVVIPQGLGTGQLYDNNIESPLQVKKGTIRLTQDQQWTIENLNFITV
ncbi:MAG: o-succinylbenzoate synthase [Cytophagia bacterium]|nr:o-succinylbenzoate synthase [Cytophagia bacterium]